MNIQVALDTNVLAYGYGINDARRQALALKLMNALRADVVVLPVQVLGELFNVLCRKGGWAAGRARDEVLECSERYAVQESSHSSLLHALDLSVSHGLTIWDALILSVASHAGCRLLLSENMQHGFFWGGTTVVNPFLPETHPLLATAMAA